jgi:glycerol-3-phosphate dehydrogenase (NAD+)
VSWCRVLVSRRRCEVVFAHWSVHCPLTNQPVYALFSTGVGDTFGTCFGPLSRNRKFGYRLGQGESMAEILASSTEVAEGVDTSIALVNLIKLKCKGYRMDLKYPILFGIAAILQGQLTPREGLKGIMEMPFLMESFDER